MAEREASLNALNGYGFRKHKRDFVYRSMNGRKRAYFDKKSINLAFSR